MFRQAARELHIPIAADKMTIFRTLILRSLAVLAILTLTLFYYVYKHGPYYRTFRLDANSPYMREQYAQPIGSDLHAVSRLEAMLRIAGKPQEARSLQAYYADCSLRLLANPRDPCQSKSVRSAIDVNAKQRTSPPSIPLPSQLEPVVESALAVSLPRLGPESAPSMYWPTLTDYAYQGGSVWMLKGKPDVRVFHATVKNTSSLPIRKKFRLRLGLASKSHPGLIATCPDLPPHTSEDMDIGELSPGESVDVFCSTRIQLEDGYPLTNSGEPLAELRPGAAKVDYVRFAHPDLIITYEGRSGMRYAVWQPRESGSLREVDRDVWRAGKTKGCDFIRSCPPMLRHCFLGLADGHIFWG